MEDADRDAKLGGVNRIAIANECRLSIRSHNPFDASPLRSRIMLHHQPASGADQKRAKKKPTRHRSLERLSLPTSRRRPMRLESLESRRLLTTLPTGFSETLITSNSSLTRPTAMQFSPAGELWVLEQDGIAKVIHENDGTASVAGSVTVDSRGERGLLGIAFDPKYDGSGPNTDHVYIFYTTPSPTPHNRVSRFVVENVGTAAPSLGSESIILEIDPEPQGDGSTNHNGGAIHFGNDGYLYIAVGDHNADGIFFVAPRMSPSGSIRLTESFYESM